MHLFELTLAVCGFYGVVLTVLVPKGFFACCVLVYRLFVFYVKCFRYGVVILWFVLVNFVVLICFVLFWW